MLDTLREMSIFILSWKFGEIAKTADFSAAATCGLSNISEERKSALKSALQAKGCVCSSDEELEACIALIAGRLINRE